MEKVDLNAIAKAYYKSWEDKNHARAVDFVREKVIPMLVKKAQSGVYSCFIVIKDESLSWTEIQKEILKRAECKIEGSGRGFLVYWS